MSHDVLLLLCAGSSQPHYGELGSGYQADLDDGNE
jgi:hypothetical protein